MKNPLKWILLLVLFLIISVPQKAAARSVPASNDPDVNVRLRGWNDANFPGTLIDHAGFEDPKAPQLSTLIGDAENHNPTFTYFGQVKAISGSGLDSSNTAVPGIGSIRTNPGATIYSPKQGYELGGGFSYIVLYASLNDIVIHATAEDSVASGYTLHLFNINVNKTLLDLYNQNEANGRAQLVAIPCHYNLGSVVGPDMRISIRDTGSFMDFRYKDWWTMPVISNCKDIPPGLLTALKKPPSGEFLPNDPLDVPKTVVKKKNPGVGIGSSIDAVLGNSVTESDMGFDTSAFTGATFYDASIPNNKLNEAFQPAVDFGGKLLPASLQKKVQNPSQQKYPPGSPEELGHYDEVYDPGCTESHFEGGKNTSGEQWAKTAAAAKTPDTYWDLQANLHNLSSILVPGQSSGLQWQIKQPNIVTKGTDGTLTLTGNYPTRFPCGERISPKQVAAVNVQTFGPIQAILSIVSDVVSNLWSLITGNVTECTTDANGKQTCTTYNKYQAIYLTTNTATIKTPGMKDIKDQAIGDMGALFAFHPDAIKDRLPRDEGFTNENQGSGNVLAASTDPNDPNSIPHAQTYAVAKTWQLTSSCMLMPKSLQEAGGTKCKLEGEGTSAQPPTSAVQPPTKTDPVKQYLFESVCNGQLCYDYIIGQLLSAPRCNGKYLNPYAAIAIALNENGGLASNRPDGASLKHFGCDPFGRAGVAPDPVSKFQCMANTLTNDCAAGKSDATTLAEYGYTPSNNLDTLAGLLGGNYLPLFVNELDARSFGIRLKNLLPTQRDLWARYYVGYTKALTGDVLKP